MSLELFGLNFLYSVLATVLGGFVLAAIFFWFRERIFPLPQVTGRWFFEMHTVSTTYKPYQGMILRYIAMIWREGNRVEGTVEKIYENSSTGQRSYEESNRTRGVIKGFIEKNYFSKDRVFLHVVEDGHGRESTHFFQLDADSNDSMLGNFSSMVANQDGKISWQRKEF